MAKHTETMNAKACSYAEAVAGIPDEVSVYISGSPIALLNAVYENKDQYKNLHFYTMMPTGPEAAFFRPDTFQNFTYGCSMWGPCEIQTSRLGGRIDHNITHFSNFEAVIRNNMKPQYLFAQVSEMDEDGYFYMTPCAEDARCVIDMGAKVIVEVNKMIPMTPTDYYRIHVDEVDALCYAEAPLFEQYPYIPPTEDEKMIASHIIDRIPDGATIQIGVGTVPAAVCNCLTGKKHLGVHSEVITESITELMRLGVVDNSQKSLYPGLSIAGFAGGTRRTLDYIHKNDKILLRSLAWVNNPAVIAQNNNMISINSCLGVDLTGQVCAESIGQGRSGGTGGQVDFVRGSQMAKGGMSFIAMHAVAQKKDGTLVSKITLDLPAGSIVTTLRNDVQYIVTEYGIADLKYKSEAQRAKALIAIAHPDFRDELAFQAKKANLIF